MTSLRPVQGETTEVIDALAAWLAHDAPESLIVETSGSTGRPKRVELSRRALLASADATHERLGGPGRWLLALPITYVAGLQVAIRSLRAGAPPVLVEQDWVAAVAAAGPGRRYTSLVPTQLHRLLEEPRTATALGALDAVLLGGGPIDPLLRARAEAAGVPIVATYGSSETSGGCVYDGVPLRGVDIVVDDRGRILIGGPMLFDGYDGDPALTAETLVDGRLVTSDLGSLHDGRLRVLGRVDDVVISGGVNVPTPAVAARLLEHPEVAQCHVLGVPDEEWGQRVVAFVRLAPSAAASPTGGPTPGDLREWVATAAGMDRRWAPRQVVVVPEMPLLANGKVDRVGLRDLAADRSEAR